MVKKKLTPFANRCMVNNFAKFYLPLTFKGPMGNAKNKFNYFQIAMSKATEIYVM